MIDLISEVAVARGIPFEPLCAAIEESLAASYAQETGSRHVVVRMDRESGELKLWERRTVVDVVSDPKSEIALSGAPHGYAVADFLDVPVDPGKFGRLAAVAAKQIVARRVVEHERERVFQRYRALEGTVLEVLVQRVDRGQVYALVDDCNEALLPATEHAPAEAIWINSRVRCEISLVRKTTRGPAIFLSRSSPGFFRGLVPDVLTAAREPGRLTKIVLERAPSKATRESLRTELRGEQVDYVRACDDTLEQIQAAFEPATPQLLESPDLGVILAIGEDPIVFRDADLVGRLLQRRIVATAAENVSAVLEALEAEIASPAPIAEAPVDPELVAKLQAFALERSESADA